LLQSNEFDDTYGTFVKFRIHNLSRQLVKYKNQSGAVTSKSNNTIALN